MAVSEEHPLRVQLNPAVILLAAPSEADAEAHSSIIEMVLE